MQTAEFHKQVLAALPDARAPEGTRDDLYPFRFVSVVFAPAYIGALTEIAAGQAGDEAVERAQLLSQLLERALDEGDGEIVDALAMRVVQGRLCQHPELLAAAQPYLGPVTRSVVGKFQALVSECERREAAVRPVTRPETRSEVGAPQ